jgi:hypothetical protein
VAFTGAAIFEESRQRLRIESAHAAALLEHLARMPEFQEDARAAEARLDLLRRSLRDSGGELELAPPAQRRSSAVLAQRRLEIRGADLELRYHADPARLAAFTRRALLIHSLHGLVALAALLLATEWVLRRNLILPLDALTHQVGLMRDGHGWAPRLPETDQELGGLANALRELGPSLERQVREWIEAERRSAVVLALGSVERRLRDVRGRVLDLLAELEGAGLLAPSDRERRIRSLARAVDGIPVLIEDEARRVLASPAEPPAELAALVGRRSHAVRATSHEREGRARGVSSVRHVDASATEHSAHEG